MIFQLFGRGISPLDFVLTLVALLTALILGITVHEFAHAAAATWLGDTLPRRQGRLTFNPLAHLDVVGSLMFIVGGFGWGKPVEYNPYALRANPRTGPAIVAAAGPLGNLILAAALAIPVRLLSVTLGASPAGAEGILLALLAGVVKFNLFLGVFNLLPVFPLDGFTILQGLLPFELAEKFQITRQYGFLILLLLIFAAPGITGALLNQPVDLLMYILTGTRL